MADFCTTFGVTHPIVLAPMSGISTPKLVAAVSNAGGLGTMPLWRANADTIRSTIKQIRDLTDKPFAINLNMDFQDALQLEACLEERVDAISLFWGDTGDFIDRAKLAGTKVIVTASNAAYAKEAADRGADAICAQGFEAGGHVEGTVGTMALVPAIVDAVGDVPVIAAGGIADGRGLAAALALSASAAWIGTRFLSAEEAPTHPEYRRRLFEASEDDTGHYENLYDLGWPDAPHRALKNSTAAMWEAAGKPPMGQRPGEGDVLAHMPGRGDVLRYQSTSANTVMEGDIEALSLWAGQGVALVRKTQPAGEILREIVDEAYRRLRAF